MPKKYNEQTIKLAESFLDKLFGKVARKVTDQEIKRLTKADPKLGKLLKIANKAAEAGEKHLAKMSKKEKEEFMNRAFARVGL